MEEKLRRPQETGTQSESEQRSDGSNGISCGETVNYGLSNPHWRAQNRNSNNASNSGLSPVKRIAGFYQHAQSTENKAIVEKDSTLLPTPNQWFPLTAVSAYANLRNVSVIENETSSNPRAAAPYDGLIEDTCSREIASPSNNPQTLELKCRACNKKLHSSRTAQYHLMAIHPQLFFDDKESQLSTEQAADFSASCRKVFQTEMDRGKELMLEAKRKGERVESKNKSEKAVWCTYCNTEKRDMKHLKIHLFRYHYDILDETLKAYRLKSKVANVTIASEHVPNTEPTTRTEFNQNMEPGKKPNFRFACNAAGDLRKEIASSNLNGHPCSRLVNMKRDLTQNLESETTQEYSWQGFAQNHKSNITNTVEEDASSTWFTTATSTDEGRHGGDFHYGNATAWWNDQAAGLEAGPNLRRNGPIPNVSSHHSYAPFPNHSSQTGISSITESSNNTNTVMANQIQQYYPTTMAPDHWQYFYPPAPLDQQHQVEGNQHVLPSDSSQMYSVYPQGSSGIIMDGVSDWAADLRIPTEYPQREEHFKFNA